MRFVPYVLLIGLLLVSPGSMSIGLAQGPGPQRGVQPETDLSVADQVSNAFSYQGMLEEDGHPVTGNRDMTFRLYSDGACSTQVGSDIDKPGVEVRDGLFSVKLDVTPSDFDGQGLWIQAEVGGTSLGCQEILPVPYALSLRPGAVISRQDAGAQLAYRAVTSQSVGVDGWGDLGVYGHSSEGTGVEGRSGGTSGVGVYGNAPYKGVSGRSWSSDGFGGWFRNTATSGTTCGVYGETESSEGTAIHGLADAPDGYAGYFENRATSGDAHGVYGKTESEEGTAVYGHATASSGTTYGVRGTAESPDGYAGYFVNESTLEDSTGVHGEGAVYGLRAEATGVSEWIYEFAPDIVGVYAKAEILPGRGGRKTYGVWALGDTAVAADGNETGLSAVGAEYGVQAEGTGENGIGVDGDGDAVGVLGHGGGIGVCGLSYGADAEDAGVIGRGSSPTAGHGVIARSNGSGRDGCALLAEAEDEDKGIAIWATAMGDDSTVVLEQDEANGGDFLKAYQTDPSNLRFRLRQDGHAYADEGWHTPASDFAEMLPAVEGPEPGDVLVIGADGKLHRSREACTASVIGVYSTDPGFVGGSDDDGVNPGEVPLAVVGVVPVKASAEGGPIAPGDLLVASSTPGHAMKASASPAVGTVIGKALEALEGTSGVISMLVMLQ
jgi:hypothetical protein